MVIATIVPRYLDMERRAKQVLFGEFQDLHNLLRRYVTYVIRHSERCTREDPRERVLCPARGHKAKAATNTRIDNDHYHSWKNAEGVEDYSAGATRETTGQQEQGSGHCRGEGRPNKLLFQTGTRRGPKSKQVQHAKDPNPSRSQALKDAGDH